MFNINNYRYEGKRYCVSFYWNNKGTEEHRTTHRIFGVIEAFTSSTQVIIKDDDGDLWIIDHTLIALMQPIKM